MTLLALLLLACLRMSDRFSPVTAGRHIVAVAAHERIRSITILLHDHESEHVYIDITGTGQ